VVDETPLRQIVTVRSRFTRSVSLHRDWERGDALEGYVLTPAGREILDRLASSVRGESPTRAWSLTGPYGSGKSAFALFASQVLGGQGTAGDQARAEVKGQDAQLWKRLTQGKAQGLLCPILVTGSREPLETALVRGVTQALSHCAGRRPRSLAKHLEALSARSLFGASTSTVVDLFEETIKFVTNPGTGYQGVLLVIDELGKFLEYAAGHPDDGDVFVLQSLAEAAARSEKSFLLLTILHQAIDRYTALISPGRRQEWAKVQGRFEDVAFEEPTDQVLRLLARAVGHAGPEPARKALEQCGRELAGEAWALGCRSGAMDKREFVAQLASCMPLHPSVALLLGPLFRRLAQNERSLFAFLASGEPFGFQEFLRQQAWSRTSCAVYRLDHLYDYVTTALGGALYSQHRGKYWAEVQSVLERLHSTSPLQVRLAKVIGLVQALGYSSGSPASKEALRFALGGGGVGDAEIDEAIAELERRSTIVYRRHAGSYALWEGSDVNIEGRVEEARSTVDPARGLTSYLAEFAPPRPLVARRHSLRTGTLRYFDVAYADRASLAVVLRQEAGSADGRVVYCLPLNVEDRAAMEAALKDPSLDGRPEVVGALAGELFDLQEACQELACLRWVAQNTPELAGDATARRELRARLAAAEEALASQIRRLFLPSGGDQACRWFRRGKQVPVPSRRGLNEFLSAVCDEVYSSTPCWRNELVNRRSLSSSAAAARRNLIEAMIEHQPEEVLGIQGTPPERSMYESLLRVPGLHRKKEGKWAFQRPLPKADPALVAVWKAVEHFFEQSEGKRRPVADFFSLLSKPPYGLKEGVLPVLLAAALLYYDTEIALYEEGTFVPMLKTAVFERSIHAPEKFEVQHCRISGPRALVFGKYANMLTRPDESPDAPAPQLLSVVRPLVRFVRQLPDYVNNTQQLTPVAKAVLQAIKEAREPDQLLFTDLPKTCQAEPFSASGSSDPGQVDAFFGSLRSALAELQQAYPKLQSAVEQMVLKAFNLSGPLAQAREELAHRARLVSDLAVEPKLKSFLVRVTDGGGDEAVWLESLAALLAGKPPQAWNDQERARFEVNLALTSRLFRHFESLAFEMERGGAALLDGDDQAIRVAVTVPNAEEMERVVRIPSRLAPQTTKAQEEVRQVLAAADLLKDKELGAAVLAQVVRQLLLESQAKGT
jgi:hypothetical protein